MSKDHKLTIRLPVQLHQEMKDYVERKGTTFTQVTVDYYRYLLEQENRQEAEQL
jgi:hypothetical protein